MVALEVSCNGNIIAVLGAEDWGLLNVIVNASRARGAAEKSGEVCEFLDLRLGGMSVGSAQSKPEHLRWPRRDLHIGDEITIRVVNTMEFDEPSKRFESSASASPYESEEEELAVQKEIYEKLKIKFESPKDA